MFSLPASLRLFLSYPASPVSEHHSVVALSTPFGVLPSPPFSPSFGVLSLRFLIGSQSLSAPFLFPSRSALLTAGGGGTSPIFLCGEQRDGSGYLVLDPHPISDFAALQLSHQALGCGRSEVALMAKHADRDFCGLSMTDIVLCDHDFCNSLADFILSITRFVSARLPSSRFVWKPGVLSGSVSEARAWIADGDGLFFAVGINRKRGLIGEEVNSNKCPRPVEMAVCASSVQVFKDDGYGSGVW